MLIKDESTVTDAVIAAMDRTANPRLREVMDALVRHLHAFIRETRLTEKEFYDGLGFIASLGHHTHATNNEVVLAADVLGLSTLVEGVLGFEQRLRRRRCVRRQRRFGRGFRPPRKQQ